jgi:AraC family transcriptional regulator
MTQNLSGNFQNMEDEDGTLVDYFIESIHVRMLGCGVFTTAAERIGNFLLPAFLVVFYTSGSVEIQHGSETTVLSPGSFYIFRPNDVYSGHKLTEGALCFSYLQFDIAPFMERYNFGAVAMISTDRVFREPQYVCLGELLEKLARDDPALPGRTAMLRQLVRLILGQILYDQAGREGGAELLKKGRDSRIINEAFRYVAEHLTEPIVIGDILKACRTSKTSLERAFRGALGLTPQRALLRFKIERSMEMLMRNIPLKDIVRALGFSSVFHYSNTFKAITGLRPTEYRSRVAKKERSPERNLPGRAVDRPGRA